MGQDSRESSRTHPRIAGVEITGDSLTSRSGLALFARYLDRIGLIVNHAGRMVLKVTRATLDRLKLDELWLRCSSPPQVPRLA